MAEWKKYVSRRLLEAKQVDHDFGMYDPRTSQRVNGRAGDYLVREGGKEHIEAKEQFERWHEPVTEEAS